MAEPEVSLHPVALRRLPVRLHVALRRHMDELRREFVLIGLPAADMQADVPRRLLELIQQVQTRYGAFGQAATDGILAAAEAGERWKDVTMPVPVAIADEIDALRRLLQETDEFCRRGDLLTLATPPLLAAYREWFLGEFTMQLAGALPEPWHGPWECEPWTAAR